MGEAGVTKGGRVDFLDKIHEIEIHCLVFHYAVACLTFRGRCEFHFIKLRCNLTCNLALSFNWRCNLLI